MAFNMGDYVDVPTRLREALKRYPDLRIQETDAQVVTMPDGSTFYRCTVTVWRDATDPIPAIATAAEPYPGKTPYTKNSEFMVGMTSALGRALGYMGFGINKSIASQNEVLARTDSPTSSAPRPTTAPAQKPTVTPITTIGGQSLLTGKQLAYIKRLAEKLGMDEPALFVYVQAVLQDDSKVPEVLTLAEANRVIDALKAEEK